MNTAAPALSSIEATTPGGWVSRRRVFATAFALTALAWSVGPNTHAQSGGELRVRLESSAAITSWPNYRGPNHDGVYAAPIRTDWSVTPPRLLWRQSIEPGLSSISIANGRAFTQARRRVGSEDREFVVALDAATGHELWAVNVDLADYPDGGVGSDDGPRSTPVIDGDNVYVFTTYLRLYSLDAATGRQNWMRDFPAELGSSVVAWQNAASPVIVGDLILVNGNGGPNRLMGIRRSDGTTAWRKHDARMTQATPIATTLAGVPHVIFFTQPGLVAVRPDNGDLLWQFAFPFSTSTAASPVVADDIVYCSAAYTSGSGAVRVSASNTGATSRELWKRRNANMNHWATPVHKDGHIFGVFGQSSLSVRCVNASTGTETWRANTIGSGEIGYGSVLLVHDQLLLFTESGELVLADPDPTAYREREKFQAISGKCWNSPAVADGVIYARSTTQIAAFDVRPPAPPSPLALGSNLIVSEGRARLQVRAADGTPLTQTRANNITLLRTLDPSLPISTWETVNATRSLINGVLQIEDPNAGTTPRRFYRARE